MDINNTFQDFINRSDDNTPAPSLSTVIKNIFISCDSENTGIVPISKIIDFIAPFLQGNDDVLEELKNCLVNHVDDDNSIDYETLYRNMKAWTEKMSMTDNKVDDAGIDDASPNMHLETNRQNLSLARDLFKNYAESPESTILSTMELSNDSHEQCMAERCVLENNILELQHQKTQMNEELTRLRSELSGYQDQNESLQGNLDKLVKKLTNEQKVIENLQIEKRRGDEVQEELFCANKKNAKLEKTVSSLEKVNNQIQQDYDMLKIEKQNLEQKINTTDRKSEAVVVNIRLLQSEIDTLKNDLVSEQDTNAALLKQNEDLQDVIEQCNINIDKFKLEKETLEKLLRDHIDRNESPIDLNRTHNLLMDTSLRSNLESDDCEVPSPDRRLNESNGECIYYNLHMMMNSSESLHDEINKATNHEVTNGREDEESECDCQTRVSQIEVEKKLVALQCELLQHESCTDIISKQKEEIEHVSQENCTYKDQMESLQEMLSDLRTQVSLGQQREQLLLEKCRLLEDNLKSNNSYVIEIQSKLNEYTDLENKSKMLDQKITELEMDNSMKYIKIINLTVEMEKLREVQAKVDRQNKKELSKKISQLEDERKLHERETKELFSKIKVLNKEKVVLQREKEDLLMRIIELENERHQLQTEMDQLWLAKQNLEVENSEFKSNKDMVELQINKFQNERETLEREKNMLQSENINLEIAKDEMETNMIARLEKLEMEKESLLADVATIKQEKEKVEDALNKYKNEEPSNIKIKDEYEKTSGILEKLQEEHDQIKSNYETLQHDAMKEKEKNIELTNDNVKMSEEINKLINENLELSSKTSSVEEELKDISQKMSHYVKINEELGVANEQLTGGKNELLLKMEKNEATFKRMDIDNKHLSVDLVNLKLTFDKVKGTMEKFERFNETLITENRALKNSVEEKENLCLQNNFEIKQLQERCGTYENDINIVRNELDQSHKVRVDLENYLKFKEDLLLEVEDKLKKNMENNILEVKNMQDLIEEKQMKIEEITQDLDFQKGIEKELKSDLNTVSKKIKHESKKCDRHSKKITNLENELSEEKTLCVKFREISENLTQKDVKSKEIISKQENRIAFLERENEILNKENGSLKNKSEESDRNLAELLKTNAEFLKRNKKITEENVEFSLRCTKLSEDLSKRKEMLEKANADIEEIWDELKRTKQRVSENEQERLGLYKKKIDRYEEKNTKAENEIETLRLDKEMILQKSKCLERENMETKQQLESLLIEKDLWLTEKISIYKNEGSSEIVQAIASSKNTAKATTFDRLALKTMKLDDRIQVLEERLSTEKYKNTEKLKEITKLQDKNEFLSAENTRMKKEIDEANENNENLRSEMEELIAKVDNLIEENEKLTKINEEFENMQWKSSKSDITLNEEVEAFENAEDNSILFNLQETGVIYDLTNLREQLEHEYRKRNLTLAYMDTLKDRLCKRRLRLGRATLHAMNVWKDSLDDNVIADASKEGLQPEHLMQPFPGPLDEEILQVEHQIHLTTSFLDKLTSMKNHKLLESIQSEHNTVLDDTIEQETSSNIDRNVLENLGLSGDCKRVNDLSAVEMEEKFTALVLAFTIDRKSLRRRCSKQKNQLREKERTLGEEISTLTLDLEKYANELSEIDIISRLEHILRLSAQISISAEQYGSLIQQSNLSQGVELMMNYVASLRSNIETSSNRYLSIESFPEKVCPNNEIQLIEKNKDAHDNLEMDLHVVNPLKTKTLWTKEIHFMLTLSMAVLVAAIFLNTFGSYNGSFRGSPLLPPT